MAQSCGSRDTTLVLPGSSATYSLEITDYFNNDLSDPAQGLCGVSIDFVHQLVEDFEIVLTSPAGQSVRLIGPNGQDQFDFTFFTRWQIDFLPCGEIPAPDPPFAPVWNNNQAQNWGSGGTYSGSYHPWNGCLEDFNTGPVNGAWTVTLISNPSFYAGALTAIHLSFCDSRGVECCFADGGVIRNPSLIACEGADTLRLAPDLRFPNGRPDATEYGYTYLVGQGGIYQSRADTVDLRNAAPGTYTVCGLSYRRSELSNLPPPNGVLTLDSIRNNLLGLEPWLCAYPSNTCMEVRIVPPPDTTRLSLRICEGDSVMIGNSVFNTTGQFLATLPSYAGCDSLIQLNLEVEPVSMTMLDSIICFGQSATVGGSTYTQTGLYRDTLATADLGCDSIVVLNLLVLGNLATNIDTTLCTGESLMVGDSLLRTPGDYNILLRSSAGCDSLVNVHLEMLAPVADIAADAQVLDCLRESIRLEGAGSSPPGALAFQWFFGNTPLPGNTSSRDAIAAGLYSLVVTQTEGGRTCRDTAQINITDLARPIAAFIAPADTLTCTRNVVTLQATGSELGTHIVYEWQAQAGGHFVSDSTGFSVQVDSVGTYVLRVTDTLTHCFAEASANVVANRVAPSIQTTGGFTLNCLVLSDTLDGRASLTHPALIGVWQGDCLRNLPTPGLAVVDCPGWYVFTLEDQRNGCVAIDSVEVLLENNFPVAALSLIDTITCANPTVNLDAGNSTPAGELVFYWPGLSPQNNSDILADTPGDFLLVVENTATFCRDTLPFTIPENRDFPLAVTPAQLTINCFEPQGIVRSVGSTTGSPSIAYQWYQGGTLLTGANTDTLLVDVDGLYALSVLNTVNGCADTSFTQVIADFDPLEQVNAGPTMTLDCGQPQVQLQPDSTIFSVPVRWTWSGSCLAANIDDVWGITVDCPGQYVLEVQSLLNGCTARDTVGVEASGNFAFAVLPDSLRLSCEDGTAVLDNAGSLGSIFRWFNGSDPLIDNVNQVLVSSPGIYTLIAQTIDGACADTAQTVVYVDCLLNAQIVPPDSLTCARNAVVLDASSTTGDGPLTFQWLPPEPGCILGLGDTPVVSVLCPGVYTLIVEHELFPISDTLRVTVGIDTVPPAISAGEDQVLTCLTTEATLMGTLDGNAADFDIIWMNFQEDTLANRLVWTTTTATSYLMEVYNPRNGCLSRDIVQVMSDNSPISLAFNATVFPCTTDTLDLRVMPNPPDDDYIYQWDGIGIVRGDDTEVVTIDLLGQYAVTVTDPSSGCMASAVADIAETACVPCLEVQMPDSLDCFTTQVRIEAAFCEPCINCTVQWRYQDDPIPGANFLTFVATQPGIYTISATDTLGFSSELSVELIENTAFPMVDLGPDLEFNCDSMAYTLYNRVPVPADAVYEYRWEILPSGLLLGQSVTQLTDSVGLYRLLVTNARTGCSASDTLEIGRNFTVPQAEAGPPRYITCANDLAVLDGSGSTLNDVSYLWQSEQGSACINGATTLNPIVACPGMYFIAVRDNSSGCVAMDSVEVALSSLIPDDFQLSDTTLSCLHDTLLLQGFVPTGPGNYQAQWCMLDEDGQVLPGTCTTETSVVITQPGQYRYAISSGANCSGIRTVTVLADTLAPVIDAGLRDTFPCNAQELQLEGVAPPGVQISWNSNLGQTIANPNSLTPSVTNGGIYTLEATDTDNGCTSRDSVEIIRLAEPTLQPLPDAFLDCRVPTLTLTAIGNTDSGMENWLWQTPDGQIQGSTNTQQATLTRAGQYIVQLEDPASGCVVSDTIAVRADFLQPEARIQNLDNFVLNCYQDTLLLDATTSVSATGSPLQWQWRVQGVGSLFPTLNESTTYTDRTGLYRLFVTDTGNGCRDTLDVAVASDFVRPMSQIALPDTITCVQTAVDLQLQQPAASEGYAFQWTNTAGEVLSSVRQVTVMQSGNYFVQITNIENGCVRLDTTVVVSDTIAPFAVATVQGRLSCEQNVVLLDGTDSEGLRLRYQWQALGQGQLLGAANAAVDSAAVSGNYVLIVTQASNGCSSRDTVNVGVEGAPITGFELTALDPDCPESAGGSITVQGIMGGTPPFQFRLNGEAQGFATAFENLPPGPYVVEVEDAVGCIRQLPTVINPASELDISLGRDTSLVLGDSLRLWVNSSDSIAALRWYSSGLLPAASPNGTVVFPRESGYVVAQVTSAAGCQGSDTLFIHVDRRLPYFIPNAFTPNGDGNNDLFLIYAGGEVQTVQRLMIFDRWGEMVFERANILPNDPGTGWDGTLDGRTLNPAVFVYMAELLLKDGRVEVVYGEVVLLR